MGAEAEGEVCQEGLKSVLERRRKKARACSDGTLCLALYLNFDLCGIWRAQAGWQVLVKEGGGGVAS